MTPFAGAVLRQAFPASVGDDLERVLAVLPTASYDPSIDGTPAGRGRYVAIGGETVQAIGRIYNPEVVEISPGLTPMQAYLLAGLYTRHHDGYVRQRHIPQLLAGEQASTPLFVLQLLGEYVIEIAQTLAERVDDLDRSSFEVFATDNPDFVALTCERIVSYRACYYRNVPLVDYPAYRVVAHLGLWTGRRGRRWLSAT